MPCVYYLPGEAEQIERDEAKQKLDETTNLLCKLCKLCEKNNVALPKNIQNWWQNHKSMDILRKKEQKEKSKNSRKAGKKIGKKKSLTLIFK